MTDNNKMSLGEKMGATALAVGIASVFTGLYFFDSGVKIRPRNYPTLIQEDDIAREQIFFKQHKLKVTDAESLEKYTVFTNTYTASLETKLEEIKASPQYIAEQKNSEKDRNTQENDLLKSLFFVILGFGGIFYGTRKVGTNQQSQPSGAPQ
jgi:hypothetical protein